MPETLTKYFGPIEYREADVAQFPTGLPAFEDETQFLVIEPPASAPIVFLQACGDLAFAFSRRLSWPWILSMTWLSPGTIFNLWTSNNRRSRPSHLSGRDRSDGKRRRQRQLIGADPDQPARPAPQRSKP